MNPISADARAYWGPLMLQFGDPPEEPKQETPPVTINHDAALGAINDAVRARWMVEEERLYITEDKITQLFGKPIPGLLNCVRHGLWFAFVLEVYGRLEELGVRLGWVVAPEAAIPWHLQRRYCEIVNERMRRMKYEDTYADIARRWKSGEIEAALGSTFATPEAA